MMVDNLPTVDRKELGDTRNRLEMLFKSVLSEMDRLKGRIKLPLGVLQPTGSYDELSTSAAANIVRQLVRERLLLIAVKPVFSGELYSVWPYSKVKTNAQLEEGQFIGAFFVGNFFARCALDGP